MSTEHFSTFALFSLDTEDAMMPELHLELEDECQNGQSAYCVAMCVLQECDRTLD